MLVGSRGKGSGDERPEGEEGETKNRDKSVPGERMGGCALLLMLSYEPWSWVVPRLASALQRGIPATMCRPAHPATSNVLAAPAASVVASFTGGNSFGVQDGGPDCGQSDACTGQLFAANTPDAFLGSPEYSCCYCGRCDYGLNAEGPNSFVSGYRL